MKKLIALVLALLCIGSFAFARANTESSAGAAGPVEISIAYTDNPTLPFRHDWLTIRKVEEYFNAKIRWDVIPSTDYSTVTQLYLNTGVNAPDVILWQSIAGTNIALARNGAITPIGDYASWTPEFYARVREYGVQSDVDLTKIDGKLYNLPALYDLPFYDGGLILREDLLNRYGLPAPRTFDDLEAFARRYKQENPASYPMTVLVAPYVHYRMTMPSWGVSSHNSSSHRVLSWDYDRNQYFAGAISEQYRNYMRFWNRWYRDGLFDPEMAAPIDGDIWARKLATGASIMTYAYYDQIGGLEAASTIPGYKMNMYPPLQGPAGAHHQEKNKTGQGVLFPMGTSRRPDFERVARAVDQIFYSKQAELLWCVGVEGETYTMQGNQIRFTDNIRNAPDGIYKFMQLQYGTGSAGSQFLWVNAREMIKYDDNYAQINQRVAAMPNAIRYVAPAPLKMNERDSERATQLMAIIWDSFVKWDNDFMTGAKSLETDWNTYVQEMNSLGINEILTLYNNNL